MGLDNGILVKHVTNSKAIAILAKWRDHWYEDTPVYEICYWRKCWNVRQAILDICEQDSPNDWQYALNISEVCEIKGYLESLNEKIWDSESLYGGSIWTWEEHEPHNQTHIEALTDLIEAMQYDPDMVVYFYDSY